MTGQIVVLVLMVGVGPTQTPTAVPTLEAGVSQVGVGDYMRALLTLNDVVRQLAGTKLARAHAYRAVAYLALDEPERAIAAARLALQADPGIAIGAGEFTPDVVRLFEAARLPASPNPARTAAPKSPAPVVAVERKSAVAGTIHIYRPSAFKGGWGRAKVECNGQKMADLQNGRFVTLTAAPGAHTLRVGGKEIILEVEGGQDYYIRTSPAWNVHRTFPEEARAEMQDKSVKPGDKNRVYSTECTAKRTP